MNVARECANRPGNHGTPSFLAAEAKRLGVPGGLIVKRVIGLGELQFLPTTADAGEVQFDIRRRRGQAAERRG